MNWLSRLFGRKPAWIEGFSGTPVSETEGGKLYALIAKDECPDCHHHGFYAGPEGGMSQNIFCMNRDCRSGFNITPLSHGEGLCERIHQGDINRYPKEPAKPASIQMRLDGAAS